MSRDGPHENVIKFKPPMCFSLENVDALMKMLDAVFAELAIKRQNLIDCNNSAAPDEDLVSREPPIKKPCLSDQETSGVDQEAASVASSQLLSQKVC